jgi:hypothetical protein
MHRRLHLSRRTRPHIGAVDRARLLAVFSCSHSEAAIGRRYWSRTLYPEGSLYGCYLAKTKRDEVEARLAMIH